MYSQRKTNSPRALVVGSSGWEGADDEDEKEVK